VVEGTSLQVAAAPSVVQDSLVPVQDSTLLQLGAALVGLCSGVNAQPLLAPPLSGTVGRWSFVVMLLPCLHFLGMALGMFQLVVMLSRFIPNPRVRFVSVAVDWSQDVTPLLQALIMSLRVAPLGLAWNWSSLSRLSHLRS
jgi:hypothetical protein